MLTKTTQFERIHDGAFKVHEVASSSYEAVISRADSGSFELSTFAYYQFFAGAECRDHMQDKVNFKDVSSLLSKLGMSLVDNSNAPEPILVTLIRSEVEVMKLLLEARMKHCEVERDRRSENFNPDTYISQKLLLLDIREWLMVYSVDIVRRHIPQNA